MSGVRRFLSRREKSPQHHHHGRDAILQPRKAPRKPDHFGGIFTVKDDPHKKPDKEEEKKIKAVLDRMRQFRIDNFVESNVAYALRSPSSHGDAEAAFRLLMLLEDTYEGLVMPYTPGLKLLGAVNRDAVTCFMDTLLFAMFAKLDSFEAMLYENFEDIKRKRLAGMLRLWVNMLRTGRLITTDITERLQRALAECGWAEAATHRQQDPSEAFTFITGQLELPMLTLKMDMYHTGKEDPQDDHKFVNERLLEVAILEEPQEGSQVITLEHCLEHYFNNRIEVKRHLEHRRNTLKGEPPPDIRREASKIEKDSASHVEVFEVPETPAAETPIAETPGQSKSTRVETLRPTMSRKRADSIFSQRKVDVLYGIDAEKSVDDETDSAQDLMPRKLSTRTEVLMPAWQFFKLLPWYTENMPTSDAQVAAHFSRMRPVLGICLKRYSYTNTGQARKLETYVDIPLEIAVPDFVSDDNMREGGPLMGNFTLLLQSVVCHRGVSVNSGHYICLCRGQAPNAQQSLNREDRRGSNESEELDDPWMRFDDLAQERVSYVDIHEALKQEMPYLLFYQVQPIGNVRHSVDELPSYNEVMERSQSDAGIVEKPHWHEPEWSDTALNPVMSDPYATDQPSMEVANRAAVSERTSLDTNAMLEPPRGRPLGDGEVRRKSHAFETSSMSENSGQDPTPTSNSVPSTPSEEKSTSFLSVANKINARRGSRQSKTNGGSRSRPTSTDNSNRFSLNMSRLTQRVSRSDADVPIGPPSEHVAAELAVEKDADRPPVATAALPEATSKKSVPPSKPLPHATLSKARKERLGKRKGAKQEERDCVLM